MKIEAMELFRVSMPLVYPFRTAFGNDDTIESVFVKLYSDGNYGWGESTPWVSPGYSPECAATAFMVLEKFLCPLVIGKDIKSGRHLQELLSPVKGNYFAKAGIDVAFWDLHSKAQNKPLWQVLGGIGDTVEVGADIGILESLEQLISEIAEAIEQRFKRVKLKYRPEWELEMIAKVRQEFPDIVCHVDCNSAYSLDDLEMLKELDKYDLAMIEQPLMNDDLVDHATLQAELKTPICLDESITSVYKVRQAAEISACKWINVKYHRVGGITNALAVINQSEKLGLPCWIGSMLESSLGGHVNAALATLHNIKYPSDIFPTSRFYRKDLSVPEMVLTGPSEIKLPDKAGIGAEPDPLQLDRMKLNYSYIK
jgi:O-succinylbenzoate synthase